MLNLTEPYSPLNTRKFWLLVLRGTQNPTCSHKKTQDRLTIPGHSYKMLLSKSLVLSFPNTPLTLLPFFS